MNNHMLILGAQDIATLLADREQEIMDVVQQAYLTHASGATEVPHSTFLRVPHQRNNRIIALPAFVGGDMNIAGVKWIASFPQNVDQGLDRASAVVVLNDLDTGCPYALLEGSIISARRTAASAALGAVHLHAGKKVSRIAFIGCGLINFEIFRFLIKSFPDVEQFNGYDINIQSLDHFKQRCQSIMSHAQFKTCTTLDDAFYESDIISFATTSSHPYISSIANCQPSSTLLHISLRDLSPQVILACDNVVDDTDHICRAQTSLQLTEQLTGNRNFIRGTIVDVMLETISPRQDAERVAIFSPFGLGILDLAVSKLVYSLANIHQRGVVIESFLPHPWRQKD